MTFCQNILQYTRASYILSIHILQSLVTPSVCDQDVARSDGKP